MFPRTWTAAAAPWVALALAVVGLLGVWAFVDLSPEVEGDFFFAEDDPQLQASQQISERYGSGSQIVVRVADLSGDPDAYRYLPNSLQGFPDATAMSGLMEDVGLTQVSVRKLGGGAVALHVGLKPTA